MKCLKCGNHLEPKEAVRDHRTGNKICTRCAETAAVNGFILVWNRGTLHIAPAHVETTYCGQVDIPYVTTKYDVNPEGTRRPDQRRTEEFNGFDQHSYAKDRYCAWCAADYREITGETVSVGVETV